MANYEVALTFEDGVTQFIRCRDSHTIADAAYLRGINIPVDCTDGVCGTCKAFCESGSFEMGSHLQVALDDDEEAAGYMLPCVTKPRSDLVLRILCTSEVAKIQAATYTGTVVDLQRLSPTTVLLGVQIPNRADLTFLPGQYVNIAVPGTEVTRSYSFSNPPHQEKLTFLVKLTPGGAMSTYLTERAAVGDALTFTGPHGSFFLRETENPILLLAGGTGLAPVLSMLQKLRADGSRRPAHLIYGVNTDDDLVELDTLTAAAAELPSLTWDYCVVDPGSAAPNKGPDKAYVTSLIADDHLHDGQVAVYVCGPPPMVDAVRRRFVDLDPAPIAFYYEKFALATPTGAEAAAAPAPAVQEPAAAAPTAVPAAAAASARMALQQDLPLAPDARALDGQLMLPEAVIDPYPEPVSVSDQGDLVRRLAGQLVGAAGPGTAARAALDADGPLVVQALTARSVDGQEMFPTVLADLAPIVAPPPSVIASDGYQIGEDHPGIHYSDALFEARKLLELGAVELTVGRLTNQQITGYRILAEATVPWVDGDRLVDAAHWAETNSAFHDYLFTLTGNQHLLEAYHALGVRGRMDEVLHDACWIHPRSAQDHLDIVDAFEAGDRERVRTLFIDHSQRAIDSMRRAMADELAAQRPRFLTPGRFADKVVVITGATQDVAGRTARRIHAEGGQLVLAGASETVAKLAEELSTSGPRVLAVTVDLHQPGGARTLMEQTLTAFGRIDILINNADPSPASRRTELDDPELDDTLITTLRTCRAVLPTMHSQQRGVIVNAQTIPEPAANAAVNAVTAALATQHAGTAIRVLGTTPAAGSTADPSPITHRQQLDEHAATLCFLASDEAASITGAVLPLVTTS